MMGLRSDEREELRLLRRKVRRLEEKEARPGPSREGVRDPVSVYRHI
jgi:hypothetical protein